MKNGVEGKVLVRWMERTIRLFRRSRSEGNQLLEEKAVALLDRIMESCSLAMPITYGEGLCGIGTGIAYLLQEGFVGGDSDEILNETDSAVYSAINSRPLATLGFNDGVCGLAYYLYYRLRQREDLDGIYALQMKEYLVYLIDWITDLLPQVKKVHLLYEVSCMLGLLHQLNVMNAKIDKLMEYSLGAIVEFRSLSADMPVVRNPVSVGETKPCAEGELMGNAPCVSIVIPLRVDSPEREENLKFVLSLLLQNEFISVDILEADVEPHFWLSEKSDRIRYRFVKDSDPILHRTRYLNELILAAKNPIVGVWDTDVILSSAQIRQAVESVEAGAVMCFPYDGTFIFLDKEVSCSVRNEPTILDQLDVSPSFGRPSVGGAFLVNRAEYLKAGGENERFYGWGAEDAERVKRMEILELPVTRMDGSLFHLFHPRGINSFFDNGSRDIQNRNAFLDTCRKTKQELLTFVNESKKHPDINV